jgi:hypothetical protein
MYIYIETFFCIITHRDMKTREEMEVKLDAVLTSTMDGYAWQDLLLGHYDPGEMDAGIHRIGARVGAGSGLNAVARKIP